MRISIICCSFVTKYTKMRKVIALGETTMDIIFQHNQPIAAVPGGSCFNSIISIGRTGTPSIFLGYTGDDLVGQQTEEFLKANGVCTDYFCKKAHEKSAISLAFLNENGDANYQFYKTPPQADPETVLPTFEKGDVLLFGSYYASSPGTREHIMKVLETAKKADSIVYYDLNFRKSHLYELDKLTPAILDNFRHSHIVRGSADDFEIVYNERDARTLYAQHIAQYCPIFICTSGPGLITICTPAHAMDFNVPAVKTVSTVGAGDSFNAGFIYALTQLDIHADQLSHLSEEVWTRLMKCGCDFAAQVCQSEQNSISPQFGKDYKLE